MTYFKIFQNDKGPCTISLPSEIIGHSPLHCNFCPLHYSILGRAWNVLRKRPGKHELLSEFEKLIARTSSQIICLQSCDILQCSVLPELLAIIKRHKKKAFLITPGLKLHDRSLLHKISQFFPSFLLTFLTVDKDIYYRMTRVRNAAALMKKALRNISRTVLHYEVSIVVTRENVRTLARTIQYLLKEVRPSAIYVSYYFLDKSVPSFSFLDIPFLFRKSLFPSFREINSELLRSDLSASPRPFSLLFQNLPACQLSEEFFKKNPNIRCSFLSSGPFLSPYKKYPICSTCPFDTSCQGFSVYNAHHVPPSEKDMPRLQLLFNKIH